MKTLTHPTPISLPKRPPTRQPDKALPLALRGMNWLDRRSPFWVCLIGALLILLIGAISHATGPEISCSLLYLIPVILVTRVSGFYSGVSAAFLAASIWFIVDLVGKPSYTHPVTPYWNAIMRLGTFLVAAGLVTGMRSLTDHLEDRVAARTAELELEIAEKRQLEKRILEISDTERAAVGLDLHDGLCQHLVSAAFSCNLLEEKLALNAPAQVKEVSRISEMIDDSITQARNLAKGLFPVRLESDGLDMALQELASNINRRYGIECQVECQDGVPACGRTTGIHLYRIAQEAIVNSGKHSRAETVSVLLSVDSGGVSLTVEDQGERQGDCAPLAMSEGMGLRIMEYRARLIGADFHAGHNPDKGFKVTCKVDHDTYSR